MLNLNKIEAGKVAREPFPYMVAENVLENGALDQISRDFPVIASPGVFPLSGLRVEGAFKRLVEEIDGEALEALMEEKFGVDLSGLPLMITVRGMCRRKDGKIHTDSKDKVLTCLLYLNDSSWKADGGRLRLLRDGKNLDNMITEISPQGGNLVAFVRTDNAWHGHAPFEGSRRSIMFNWMKSDAMLSKNIGRHKLSAIFKRMGFFNGY